MARDTVHPERGWIMNFATKPLIAIRICVLRAVTEISSLRALFLCRSNTCSQCCIGTKARAPHSERQEDVFASKLIEWHAADATHNLAQGNESDVAINEPGARRVSQRFAGQSIDGFIVAGPTIFQVEVRRVAGAMC